MLAIFESILPIFLLIVAGNLLRRTPLIDDSGWPGLEQIGYWFLYPVLLFITILRADFSGLELDRMMAALGGALALLLVSMAALWPLFRATGLVARSQYSSVYQTSVRWNGFMALAVAQKLFPPEGAAVVALVMAVIIIPINFASVYVVTHFATGPSGLGRTARAIATNPLIIASAAAIVMRMMPFGLYQPIGVTLDLIGSAALGMGLVAIGAGLRPGDLLATSSALWIPVAIKLVVFPAMLLALALGFGVGGDGLVYLMLCGAMPTAMNGYLLARRLGGDAPLYAAVTTMQTIVAFFTIPAVLWITGRLGGVQV
ncbi:MAG: AEC family transporter [Rhizobiaceae bacterium]|nr:AEC family transporter [Rhizobiaceae bacterium]MCV0405239.1 AEC family transporter [Rhizobiaceae bacterium]